MPADMDALNYPYIRIRSAEWLKRTLLIFPHVVRMSPVEHAPADDPEIAKFCWEYGQRAPLLRSANLWAPYVEKAQQVLVRDLRSLEERDPAEFERFRLRAPLRADRGETDKSLTIWERRLADGASFQVHRDKLFGELVSYLKENGLAWVPPRDDSHGMRYLAMNPRLGEALMATLAMACAENEGFQVVTEFPHLHGKLVGVPRAEIMNVCLDEEVEGGITGQQQVAEFFVYRRCDVDNLTPERIAALRSERHALVDFRCELEALAASLPPLIHDQRALEERLQDVLNDMFKAWEEDQANLSAFARQMFGRGSLRDPQKLVEKFVDQAVKPGVVGGSLGAGAFMAHAPALISAGAGFVVAVVFRAVSVWGDTRRAARASPLRYLTALQDHGVSFQMTA